MKKRKDVLRLVPKNRKNCRSSLRNKTLESSLTLMLSHRSSGIFVGAAGHTSARLSFAS